MIIAVDFDGTLHNGVYPNIGEPQEGAVDVMHKLDRDGHVLIIWSCRSGDDQTAMINWLLEYGIPFNRVNDNDAGKIKKFSNNSRKVYAHLYIDDKQVGGLPPWDEIYEEVRLMNVNYELKK